MGVTSSCSDSSEKSGCGKSKLSADLSLAAGLSALALLLLSLSLYCTSASSPAWVTLAGSDLGDGDDSQVQEINCSTFQIEKVDEPTSS